MPRTRPALHVQVKKPKRADVTKEKIAIIGKLGRQMDVALGIKSSTQRFMKLCAVQKKYEGHGMYWAARMVERVAESAWRETVNIKRDPFCAKKNKTEVCYICHLEKPISEFPKSSRKTDKYLGKCQQCAREYAKKYAEKYRKK